LTETKIISLLNGAIHYLDVVNRGGRDLMVVGFTTTCAINAYYHLSCEFEPRSW